MGDHMQITNLKAASPAKKAGLKASGMLNTEQKLEDMFAQQLNRLLGMYSNKGKERISPDAKNGSNPEQLSREIKVSDKSEEAQSGTEKKDDQNKTSVHKAHELFLNSILHRKGQKSNAKNHKNDLNTVRNQKISTEPGTGKTNDVQHPEPAILKNQYQYHQTKPDNLRAESISGKKIKTKEEKAAQVPRVHKVRDAKKTSEIITATNDKHNTVDHDKSEMEMAAGTNKSSEKEIKVSVHNSLPNIHKQSGKKVFSEDKRDGRKANDQKHKQFRKASFKSGSKIESTGIKVAVEKRTVKRDHKPGATMNVHRSDKPAEQSERGNGSISMKRSIISDSGKFTIRRHIALGPNHGRDIRRKGKDVDRAEFSRINKSGHHQKNKTVPETQSIGSANDKIKALDTGLTQKGNLELDTEKKHYQNENGKVTSSGKMPVSIHSPNNAGISSGISKKLVNFVEKQVINGNAADRAEQWQRHKFILDDGQHLNVSVRQMDGVLKLHIGAGNAEINRILHQHLQEIKHHMQENFQLEIDLQLQNQSQQQDQPHRREMLNPDGLGDGGNTSPVTSTESMEVNDSAAIHSRTRLLGFNRKEWTA